MIYYRVPVGLDQRAVCKPGLYTGKIERFLIRDELYTEKECQRYGLDPAELVKTEIPKTRIYWFFGARFEYKGEQ